MNFNVLFVEALYTLYLFVGFNAGFIKHPTDPPAHAEGIYFPDEELSSHSSISRLLSRLLLVVALARRAVMLLVEQALACSRWERFYFPRVVVNFRWAAV
jgi:hypothetical protein